MGGLGYIGCAWWDADRWIEEMEREVRWHMGIWEYGRRLCPHRGGMRRAKGFSRRYFRRSSRRLPGGLRRVSGGFVCQLPDGFPHGVPWGYSRRFPAVFQGLAGRPLINCRWRAGGWRVHMSFPTVFPAGVGRIHSDSFPAVFPMEFSEAIPGGFRLFFSASPGVC